MTRSYQHLGVGQLLRYHGLSQATIAKELELAPSSVHRALKGEGRQVTLWQVLAVIGKRCGLAVAKQVKEAAEA